MALKLIRGECNTEATTSTGIAMFGRRRGAGRKYAITALSQKQDWNEVHSLVIEPADLVNEHGPLGASGVRDALLHHVAGELVLRQRQHLPAHSGDQDGLVLGSAVLCNKQTNVTLFYGTQSSAVGSIAVGTFLG